MENVVADHLSRLERENEVEEQREIEEFFLDEQLMMVNTSLPWYVDMELLVMLRHGTAMSQHGLISGSTPLCHVVTSYPLMSQHQNPPWSLVSIMSWHKLSSCSDMEDILIFTYCHVTT